jgi:hypothetical protein
MPRERIVLRTLTTQEAAKIKRLVYSRTEPGGMVQRAWLIQAMLDDPELNATDAGLPIGYSSRASGPHWVKRVNAESIVGLGDKPRRSSVVPSLR